MRDRYAAYNGIGADWQSCLAHIIRKAKEVGQEHALLPDTERDGKTAIFCARVVKRMQEACETAEKLRAGALPWSTTADIERRSIADLKKICKRPLNFKPAETLRAYLAGPDQKSSLPSCASRRAADEQSSGAVAQAHGDLSESLLRDALSTRTQNPQHPAEPGPDRQTARRPSEGIPGNPPYGGHRRGTGGAV